MDNLSKMADTPIAPKELQKIAESQLDRVLGFFPRADSKNSVVLAINTGMLGLLVANISDQMIHSYLVYFAIIPAALIGVSFYHLYRGAFPKLAGGKNSLIYFRSVGSLLEADYKEKFIAISEHEYIDDLLGQIWRNSEILKEKFNHLEYAFNFMALAIIPWLIVLGIFVLTKNSSQIPQIPFT